MTASFPFPFNFSLVAGLGGILLRPLLHAFSGFFPSGFLLSLLEEALSSQALFSSQALMVFFDIFCLNIILFFFLSSSELLYIILLRFREHG